MGSWKIIDMRLPRRRAGAVGSRSEQVFALEQNAARRWLSAPFGSRPMTDCAVTDLPDPDSPTMHTISPGADVDRHILDAVGTVGAVRADRSVRLWIERTGRLSVIAHGSHTRLREARVERVAQAVAQHVDGEHRQREEDAGKEDVVGKMRNSDAPLGHDVAPGRRLAAECRRRGTTGSPRSGWPRRRCRSPARSAAPWCSAARGGSAAAASACRPRSPPRRRAPRGSKARWSAPGAPPAGFRG